MAFVVVFLGPGGKGNLESELSKEPGFIPWDVDLRRDSGMAWVRSSVRTVDGRWLEARKSVCEHLPLLASLLT